MRKWIYVTFIGGLTTSAATAFYWQLTKYLKTDQKWKTIKSQLNNQSPDFLNIISIDSDKFYPFKYLAINGTLSQQYQTIERSKQGRMGYLVVRSLKYVGKDGSEQEIAALQGWCQANHQYKPKVQDKDRLFKGILRQKQKKDYLHQKFKKSDLQTFKMNTYINLQQILIKMNIKTTNLNSHFYFQIFRPLDSNDLEPYPYQYSVDNFQLPYLTPDKHASYASFWLLSTIVGLGAIRRVLRFK